MGERKVLNRYYPPDFDPSKLPKGKKNEANDMKVRMMLPMSVRCKMCRNFMYKGTKFNTRKEDVLGETYLGIQVFRFYYRCTSCAAEFTMKTDPQNQDYTLEEGATRNFEPWREKEVAKASAEAQREEEEMGNAMRALENRTIESKQEMDIMAALDEMRSLNNAHARVSTEAALAALQREAAKQEPAVDEDDPADLAEFYKLREQAASASARSFGGVGDVDDDSDSDGADAAQRAGNGAGTSGAAAPNGINKAAEMQGGASGQSAHELQTLQQMTRAGSSNEEGAAGGGVVGGSQPVPPRPASKSLLPAMKVIIKPKRPAEVAEAEGGKRAKLDEGVAGNGVAQDEVIGGSAEPTGFTGLAGYSSSGSDASP